MRLLNRSARLLTTLSFIGALSAPMAAQDPAEKPFIDSLIAIIAHAKSPADLPSSLCAGHTDQLSRLCEGMLGTRRVSFSHDKAALIPVRDVLERSVSEKPKWPYAWYALGELRLESLTSRLIAREGPAQPLGMSHETAASNAFVKALQLDPTFALAATALGVSALPPPREVPDQLKDRIKMLRRVRKILPGPALYGAGMVELEGGDPDTAVVFLRMALAAGTFDSGLIDLALARAEYKAGHQAEGRTAFFAGAADTAKLTLSLYREQVSWVTTPAEMKQWDALALGARPAWMADFWAHRDVSDGRAAGERLAEHFRRLEVALHEYRREVPGTGIHKVSQNTGEDMLRINVQGSGGSTSSGAELMKEWEALSDNLFLSSLGDRDPFRTTPIVQPVMDDRGVVFMRHGAPDKMARYEGAPPSGSGPGAPAVMMWRYNLPEGQLTLMFAEEDFDGTVEPNHLVPPTPGRRGLGTICYVDTSYCFDGLKLTPAIVVEARNRGLADIRTAIMTDEFIRHFDKPLHPGVQYLGLVNSAEGSGRLVVPFALPGGEMVSAPLSGGRAGYTVRIQLQASRRSDGRRVELDTVRRFAAAKPLVAGEFLSGVLEVLAPPGEYSGSIVLTQTEGPGAVARISSVTVPGASAKLDVSDLVLGRTGSGVSWNSGNQVVPLNPLNTFPAGSNAEAYFQVVGLMTGKEYTSRFEFFRAQDDAAAPPKLAVSFTQIAARSEMEFSRGVGLTNLAPGSYRLRLTVSGEGKSTVAEARLVIVK